MKFSTALVKFGSVGELALEVKKALTAIAAGWNVEHNPDGTHKPDVIDAAPHHTTHEQGGSDVVTFPTGLFERGRTVAMGEWIDFTPTLSADVGTATLTTSYNSQYALVGRMMTVSFYWLINVTGAPNYLRSALPAAISTQRYTCNVCLDETGAAFMMQTTPTGTQLLLYRNALGTGTWTAGAHTIGGTATFPIA